MIFTLQSYKRPLTCCHTAKAQYHGRSRRNTADALPKAAMAVVFLIQISEALGGFALFPFVVFMLVISA